MTPRPTVCAAHQSHKHDKWFLHLVLLSVGLPAPPSHSFVRLTWRNPTSSAPQQYAHHKLLIGEYLHVQLGQALAIRHHADLDRDIYTNLPAHPLASHPSILPYYLVETSARVPLEYWVLNKKISSSDWAAALITAKQASALLMLKYPQYQSDGGFERIV